MPATQETVPVFIEIRKGNRSNPPTGIQVLDEDNTAVGVCFLFEGRRLWTTTVDTQRGGNFGHDMNSEMLAANTEQVI